MGLPMDDIHTPTVPSGPASTYASQNRNTAGGTSLQDLIAEKKRAEEELKALSSVLDSVSRIIRLRNDYKSLMASIEAGLHAHHAEARNNPAPQSGSASSQAPSAAAGSLEAPFAKVNSVVADSPAEEAGLRAGDKIRRFGDVDWINHEKLSKVAETVQRNEGVSQSAVTSAEDFFADIAGWVGTEEHYCQNPAKPAPFVKYRGIAFAVNTAERLGVDHYPAEDEKLRASSIIRRRGGNCPNTLEVLQQLLESQHSSNSPINLALCAVLPSRLSPGYQEIKSSFAEPTDLSFCIHREASNEPASSYIIRSKAVDSRTIINYNGLPEMSSVEFASVADHLPGMSWCHFEGRIPDVTLSCIQYLRQNHGKVKISVEVEKPGREGLQDLASVADVVFYSKGWAQVRSVSDFQSFGRADFMKGNGYGSPKECLQAQAKLASKASLLLCTWGESGVSGLEVPEDRYLECPAFKAEDHKVVDTVGAGDTFIAGMLFGLMCHDDWILDRKLKFANELAGHKVMQEGLGGLGNLMQHAY
ncbi:MAG: hypothetical protein Q9171_004758 [Xanthocarpia ochracea]